MKNEKLQIPSTSRKTARENVSISSEESDSTSDTATILSDKLDRILYVIGTLQGKFNSKFKAVFGCGINFGGAILDIVGN